MSEEKKIEWNDPESVVRSAVPDIDQETAEHCSASQVIAYLRGDAERFWREALQHPTVQAYIREHRPDQHENILCDVAGCGKKYAYRQNGFNLCFEHISTPQELQSVRDHRPM